MADKSSKPIIDFGDVSNMAPSIKRVDLIGWLMASLVFGVAAAWLALWTSWRALPGFPAPLGGLGEHAAALARCALHVAFPPVFGQSSRAYLDHLGGLAPEQSQALIWRAALAVWALCMPAILLAKWCLTPRDGLTSVRGAARFEGKRAALELKGALAQRVARRPDHEIVPGVRYPASMWTRHVLMVAGSGSGKSTALKPLIRSVVEAGESLLLFDPKGEFTKGFRAPDIIAPWDARSLAWDIAKDMRNVGDMRRFAGSMIRDANDPMWSNAARNVFVGFLMYLKSTHGDDWGWQEIADLMAIPQANILPMMEQHHPEAIRSVERMGVTTQGILINLSAFSAPIFDLAAAWGALPRSRRVSFVDWAHQKGARNQLILQGHGAYPDLTKSCLEGIVGTVAAIVNSVEMDDDENRKLWLIADECPQMGRVPIRTLLDVGRSRGFRCVLACQDLSQLEEIHGAHMVKAAFSMVGTIVVGQMQGETAEQMCKALGTREVERANLSSSQGGGPKGGSATLSYSREELALYKPSELASRLGPTSDEAGVVFALVTGGNAYELFWLRFRMASARPAHVPASWTARFAATTPIADVPMPEPALDSLPPASSTAPGASASVEPPPTSATGVPWDFGGLEPQIPGAGDEVDLPLDLDAAAFDEIFEELERIHGDLAPSAASAPEGESSRTGKSSL